MPDDNNEEPAGLVALLLGNYEAVSMFAANAKTHAGRAYFTAAAKQIDGAIEFVRSGQRWESGE
jgi:hypothetical protein